MTDQPRSRAALVAAGITVVLWASAFVAIRAAGEHFSPGSLALGRLATASLVLLSIVLVTRRGLPPRAARPGILWSGLLWFGLYMVALNWGEQEVDAGTAALVVNLGPVLIALLSARLLGEGLPRPLVAGTLVAFCGAAVIGLSTAGNEGASLPGVLLCLVAAVGYAIGVVAQKPALRHADALVVTAYACLVGTLFCLPFTGVLVTEVAAAPWRATATVVYLGLFPTALAFTTWAFALSRMPAGRLGATTYLVPALVLVMSWALLGETPVLGAVVGGALCLVGVAVSRRKDSGTARSRPRAGERLR
ncbi:DMT family transporter [Nocardiopsis sp. JB363]|uniref:DMT family transporter n=1 Tax=Nocardiopsis sp. JB363 TaxID=1434837 RepID=UPI00097A7348|nr:DMT family transporter [Nocardiopsis sp. JB363]SIO89424.1 Permease of the drug/metabolite transporter (DMT) superfamily [Nocardiopsis sp. JB363]